MVAIRITPKTIFMDYIAGIFEMIALYVLGDKNRYGFVFMICGSLLWISYALYNGHSYGLLIPCVPAIFINIRNFVKWGRDNEI